MDFVDLKFSSSIYFKGEANADISKEVDFDVEEEDLPQSEFKPAPVIPKEENTTGCNKKIYFVFNEGKKWYAYGIWCLKVYKCDWIRQISATTTMNFGAKKWNFVLYKKLLWTLGSIPLALQFFTGFHPIGSTVLSWVPSHWLYGSFSPLLVSCAQH